MTENPTRSATESTKINELPTLRDWFAMQAVCGFLSAPGQDAEHGRANPSHVSAWAYQVADAMLAERSK